MGKKANELSPLSVSRLVQPGLHFVGGVAGLALQVSVSGARSWILRVSVAGKRRDMGLGGYPDVTLAMARDRARQARDQVRNGTDPIEDARARRSALLAERAAALTFDECAAAYIEAHESGWRSPKHAAQWRTTLKSYASPIIGALLVRDVQLSHVMRILEPIWSTTTETATRVRGRIEAVLDWATVRGYRSGENPARWRGHLDKLLPKPSKVAPVKNHAALEWQDMPQFMAELRKLTGAGARALEFAILTAARSGEARGARWSEIDIARGVWTIPATRMKAGKEHRVPLSPAVVDLLRAVPKFAESEYVFVGAKGCALSDMTLTAVLRRMKRKVTVHGFRSSFRDWAAESTAYPNEVAEMALAHAIGNETEAAYRRGDLFAKRARMMCDWAQYCERQATAVAEVVALHG
ncbi:integrase arm-type DNA-binding domain-containing protein [Aromatoleum toluolicum]|uniref:Tyrosine-type recombinase/integrase n=1 Tax=Aromatoleum toluolicum TaxID=90060 RepID=A0ABX1NA18_9RHOO|nr:site-specific integrase [Aromatoleum toluolicum]NMF96132.1 integrase arm-type DNA-binding domain-containing protein [Aromatoleum toluolicum]